MPRIFHRSILFTRIGDISHFTVVKVSDAVAPGPSFRRFLTMDVNSVPSSQPWDTHSIGKKWTAFFTTRVRYVSLQCWTKFTIQQNINPVTQVLSVAISQWAWKYIVHRPNNLTPNRLIHEMSAKIKRTVNRTHTMYWNSFWELT